LHDAIKHVVKACFNGKRLVVFSGGSSKSEEEILIEVKAIMDGGGSGSIMGRNSFQRPKADALNLLDKICKIYSK
jgi:class I fructose-bisphosphate aldolase